MGHWPTYFCDESYLREVAGWILELRALPSMIDNISHMRVSYARMKWMKYGSPAGIPPKRRSRSADCADLR